MSNDESQRLLLSGGAPNPALQPLEPPSPLQIPTKQENDVPAFNPSAPGFPPQQQSYPQPQGYPPPQGYFPPQGYGYPPGNELSSSYPKSQPQGYQSPPHGGPPPPQQQPQQLPQGYYPPQGYGSQMQPQQQPQYGYQQQPCYPPQQPAQMTHAPAPNITITQTQGANSGQQPATIIIKEKVVLVFFYSHLQKII